MVNGKPCSAGVSPDFRNESTEGATNGKCDVRDLLLPACIRASPAVAAETVDLVLVNGKIVTVDDRFTIAQAVAIKGERIVAVGSTADVRKLAASERTKVIDLSGRTVIPGLIDNHAHWIRAAEHDELRFDGVTSRKQALTMLAERVRRAKPGEWIVTLGGWSEEQFTDDPRGFPLEELDRIAPNNPVVLQAIYRHSYLNTAALKAAQIDEATPDPRGGKIEKDASGKLTGMVSGAGGVAFVAAKIPLPEKEQWLAQARKARRGAELDGHHGLARRGRPRHGRQALRALSRARRAAASSTRARSGRRSGSRRRPREVDKVLAEIPQQKPFQGNDYFDNVGWGESVYAPLTTQLLSPASNTKPEDLAQMRRIARALAQRGLYVNSHVEMTAAIDAFLDVYEELNRDAPIKGPALVVLAPRPGERGAARAHEAARHDARRSTAGRSSRARSCTRRTASARGTCRRSGACRIAASSGASGPTRRR